MNEFQESFFYQSSDNIVNTTWIKVEQEKNLAGNLNYYAMYSLGGEPTQERSRIIWYRINIWGFLSSFGGLVTSIFGIASAIMSSFNNYEENKAMLSRLYGHSEDTDRVKTDSDIEYGTYYATRTFEDHVKGRRELSNSYFSILLFKFLTSCCCCFQTCCSRVLCIKRGENRYRKYELALKRLSKEQDIQYFIEMNRISRLLHKMNLLQRQRHAIDYSHKYVVTDKDIQKAAKKPSHANKED